MKRTRLIAPVLVGVVLFAGGCGGRNENESARSPAKVEEVAGQTRVVLSAEAANRLGIETTPVRSGAGTKTVIPFAAVLYDPNGATWTYTSPKPLVFVRKNIRVDHVQGGRAILSAGPPSGTPVVTVGATEIWGVEYGGIKED
jgi:hypothetical protein